MLMLSFKVFLKIIRIYLDNTLFLFKMPILIVLIHFLDN
ncbi:hypothetical protein LEP1GSC045_3547 [Leptospira interrogans serovar Pomona str. Kennewicki LC82-25]|uniref:Uncharacterized protein n=1 Tax=Leptospira interrogans str. UI 12621 TaxID=1049937 RepID=A0A0F6H763_LEPIR|nr:hypothetical protein LEP1GSC045_3547 [Leptospira interrogans serovar Pomona str. Kennewicki LC82-25]EKN99480.1 hypothetical protein LEP1GSC014_2279 [Leptospira interrogans serovar Pomona str. Pomona]EKO24071.1 hypothetical protein LEP1GSC104_2454 [Leptospira interrogans str. UI 12621]EKO69720.1 hypothetical protein LEP1GSC069_1663 [Leptospira interrogans serovar Canicola str. Fiocruz LV133]EMF34217.1 hypothetical protein LEP1GSC201_3214 [Leptospira interrogans serovar Pomona str. Fox 32256]